MALRQKYWFIRPQNEAQLLSENEFSNLEAIEPIPDVKCPHCGGMGQHQRLRATDIARAFEWDDLYCGQCGRPFKSYHMTAQRQS